MDWKEKKCAHHVIKKKKNKEVYVSQGSRSRQKKEDCPDNS